MNISNPIATRIAPPKIEALLERTVPNFLPMQIPPKQIPNVTIAMMEASRSAKGKVR